jgi:hypothetical protein
LQKAEVRRLQERCRISEGHAKLAKQQLARSDQQRIEGQQQLEKLKQDFMDLKRMLPKRSGSSIGAAPLSARGHGGTNSQHGGPRTYQHLQKLEQLCVESGIQLHASEDHVGVVCSFKAFVSSWPTIRHTYSLQHLQTWKFQEDTQAAQLRPPDADP